MPATFTHAQGLKSLEVAHAAGVVMCYGSDLLGTCTPHRYGGDGGGRAVQTHGQATVVLYGRGLWHLNPAQVVSVGAWDLYTVQKGRGSQGYLYACFGYRTSRRVPC